MAANGRYCDRVWVTTPKDFEKLTCHPFSLSGTYDPAKHKGWVQFESSEHAGEARREL